MKIGGKKMDLKKGKNMDKVNEEERVVREGKMKGEKKDKRWCK